jgi:hypothetical protein
VALTTGGRLAFLRTKGVTMTQREQTLEELEALEAHADQRAALYRRKVLLGRGEPRRLAELERISAGATSRLRRARERSARP